MKSLSHNTKIVIDIGKVTASKIQINQGIKQGVTSPNSINRETKQNKNYVLSYRHKTIQY